MKFLDDVYVCGVDTGFAKRFSDDSSQPKFNVTGIDGKYSKISDTLWANSDGTRVIVDLGIQLWDGYGAMEGCFATNNVPDLDCYTEL